MANNKRIKGITIEIGGDVKGLDKALKGVNETINDTQAQLKDVQRLLKLDPKNTELLRQKQKLLAKQVGETKDRLEVLKKAEQQLKDSGVDENSAQFQALRREIIETENSLDDLERAAGESNVALSKIGATADTIADGANKVADATRGLSKAAGAGLAAAATGAVKIVDAYADYEQLVGGVETLFKESAGEIKRAAADAYKTAGLSANEYMETVTSFSASLISSLGGDTRRAASYADMAITDMADNANKMGTDIESIQNAYKGFAKQTYTMLDNLKLGYGGTQAEMERLLADAQAISGVEYDMSSFSDIIDAIHVIQTEMGITGTTAKEAAETVSGSVAAFKSSISNLVAGMGDADADIDQLVGNVVEAFKTMADNILPVLQNIWDHLPGGAKFALGAMGVTAAISPIASGIGSIASAVSSVTKVIPLIGTAFSAVGTAVSSIVGGISGIFSAIAGFVAANPVVLVVAAVVALVALIVAKWDEVKALLSSVWGFIKGVFGDLAAWFKERVIQPVSEFFSGLWEDISGFFSGIWGAVVSAFSPVVEWLETLFQGCWIIIQAVWQVASGWFDENVIQPVSEFFKQLWEDVSSFFSQLWADIVSIWSAVSDWFSVNVVQPVSGFFEGLWTDVSGFFAQLWADVVGIWSAASGWFDANVIKPVVDGFSAAWNSVKDAFRVAFDAIAGFAKSILNVVIGRVEGMINRVIDAINDLIAGFNRVVSWAAGIVGADWGGLSSISRISLPRLAKGGILSRGSAIVGEAGPELLTVAGGRTIVQPLGSGGSVTNHNLGGVSIVVYGAPGQSVNELAEVIMDKMQAAVERREAAFA